MDDENIETDGTKINLLLYFSIAKQLAMKLENPEERCQAAAWLKLLKNTEDQDMALDYLYLLVFILQRPHLTGLFTEEPPKELKPFPEGYDVLKMGREIILTNAQERLLRTKVPPEIVTAVSHDRKEYAAVQEIPGFGVHCYYTISPSPIEQWITKGRNGLSTNNGNASAWENALSQGGERAPVEVPKVEAESELKKLERVDEIIKLVKQNVKEVHSEQQSDTHKSEPSDKLKESPRLEEDGRSDPTETQSPGSGKSKKLKGSIKVKGRTRSMSADDIRLQKTDQTECELLCNMKKQSILNQKSKFREWGKAHPTATGEGGKQVDEKPLFKWHPKSVFEHNFSTSFILDDLPEDNQRRQLEKELVNGRRALESTNRGAESCLQSKCSPEIKSQRSTQVRRGTSLNPQMGKYRQPNRYSDSLETNSPVIQSVGCEGSSRDAQEGTKKQRETFKRRRLNYSVAEPSTNKMFSPKTECNFMKHFLPHLLEDRNTRTSTIMTDICKRNKKEWENEEQRFSFSPKRFKARQDEVKRVSHPNKFGVPKSNKYFSTGNIVCPTDINDTRIENTRSRNQYKSTKISCEHCAYPKDVNQYPNKYESRDVGDCSLERLYTSYVPEKSRQRTPEAPKLSNNLSQSPRPNDKPTCQHQCKTRKCIDPFDVVPSSSSSGATLGDMKWVHEETKNIETNNENAGQKCESHNRPFAHPKTVNTPSKKKGIKFADVNYSNREYVSEINTELDPNRAPFYFLDENQRRLSLTEELTEDEKAECENLNWLDAAKIAELLH